jgi:hypothetical protein
VCKSSEEEKRKVKKKSSLSISSYLPVLDDVAADNSLILSGKDVICRELLISQKELKMKNQKPRTINEEEKNQKSNHRRIVVSWLDFCVLPGGIGSSQIHYPFEGLILSGKDVRICPSDVRTAY